MKISKTILMLAMTCPLVSCTEDHKISDEYPAEISAIDTVGGAGLPFYVGNDLRPTWNLDQAPAPRTLGSFDLIDQKGWSFDTGLLKNKVTIVSFFYTECPGICPMTIQNLKAVQESFQNDDRVQMLSISITPKMDTPSKLDLYAKTNHINYNRWRLLTGDQDKIYQLARESFNADTFSKSENNVKALNPDDFLHSENIYLLDENQKIRGIYQGKQISSINQLKDNIKTLF